MAPATLTAETAPAAQAGAARAREENLDHLNRERLAIDSGAGGATRESEEARLGARKGRLCAPKVSPEDRKVSLEDCKVSPEDREVSLRDSEVSPEDCEVSPLDAKVWPTDRKISPRDGKVSPTGRARAADYFTM